MPATALALAPVVVSPRALACVVCGRAFSDPESEALGIGPECRKRHGYGRRDALPHWEAADRALYGTAAALDVTGALCDARAAAAAIVLRFAVEGRDCVYGSLYIEALRALGFRTLAQRLARRRKPITVGCEGEGPGATLLLRGPYSPDFLRALQTHGVRSTWDAVTKTRRVPAADRARLWAALEAGYPAGTLVVGPRGLRALAGR